MLPSLETLAATHNVLCRRHNLLLAFNERAARAALDEAHGLAVDERDEPAALFYTLARRARALGRLWPLYPHVVALDHAQTLGLWVQFDEAAFRRLRVECAANRVGFPDVRAWFAARYKGA